jgi:hypothetical protein
MLTASTLGFKSDAGEARILPAGTDVAKATERLKGFRVPVGNAAGEEPLIGGKKILVCAYQLPEEKPLWPFRINKKVRL